MDNIPNLGDFGYVPTPTASGNNFNWLGLFLVAICAGIACYFIYLVFFHQDEKEHLVVEKDIANALQNTQWESTSAINLNKNDGYF